MDRLIGRQEGRQVVVRRGNSPLATGQGSRIVRQAMVPMTCREVHRQVCLSTFKLWAFGSFFNCFNSILCHFTLYPKPYIMILTPKITKLKSFS